LWRFGFQAFVGASFAEIFAGNCTALGLPCVTLEEHDLAALMDSVSLDPGQQVVIDLVARTLTSRAGTVQAGLRDGVRKALLEGSWNATAVLIDAGDAIERAAARLPYASGFAARGAGS
jgi:3-isopropylmalate/(R)-2-methylmalate dehydratase small subunit